MDFDLAQKVYRQIETTKFVQLKEDLLAYHSANGHLIGMIHEGPGNLLQQLFHGSPSAFSGISTGVPGEKSAVARVELLTVRSFRPLLLCEHRIENPENAPEDEVSPEAWEGHTHALNREPSTHAQSEWHED